MAISWNDTFIGLPTEDNNPGRGAEAIRDTRKGVDERMKEDHFWGEPDENVESEVGGRHKEGSAVAYVIDEDATERDTSGERVNHIRIGTIRADMDLLGTGNWRSIAGTEINTEGGNYDNRKRKLQIHFEDADGLASFVDIFNPDNVVNMEWDQTIGGDKAFSRAVIAPADDDSAAVTAVAADFNPADPIYDTEYVVPAKLFWKWIKDSKYHNTFDLYDTDNETLRSTNAGIHGALYIDKNISANVIEGEIVRGAVWG